MLAPLNSAAARSSDTQLPAGEESLAVPNELTTPEVEINPVSSEEGSTDYQREKIAEPNLMETERPPYLDNPRQFPQNLQEESKEVPKAQPSYVDLPQEGPTESPTVEPRAIYSPKASSNGFTIDSTFEILGFTDHIMTINQVNDSIRLTINLEITEQASYQFDARLVRSDTQEQVDYRQTQPYMNPDTDHVVTVDFNGYLFRELGYNGTFDVQLQILKFNITNGSGFDPFYLLNESLVHQTSFYYSYWFPAKAEISPSFSVELVDLDNNTLYDIVLVKGMANFSYLGQYSFYSTIRDNETDQEYTWSNFEPDQGQSFYQNFEITLLFHAWQLHQSEDRVYYIDFELRQYNYPHFTILWESRLPLRYDNGTVESWTPAFNHSQWDDYPFNYGVIESSELLDTDDNGLIDFHKVTYTMNMAWGNDEFLSIDPLASRRPHIWWGYFLNSSSHIHGMEDWDPYWTAGNNTYTFYTPASIFASQEGYNYYELQFHLHIWNWHREVGHCWESGHFGGSEIISYENGSTRYFTNSEWQLAGAISSTSDFLDDTDGDGLGNDLVLQVEVNIGTPGQYNIGGQIEEEYTGSCCVMHRSTSKRIDTIGVHTFLLRFNGYELLRHGWNRTLIMRQLYLQYFNPLQDEWTTLFDRWDESGESTHIFTPYTADQFDPIPIYLTKVFSHAFIDTQGDPGKYDIVRIYAEVEVGESGRYQIDGPMGLSNNQFDHRSKTFDVGVGTNILHIDYPAYAFRRLQNNDIIFSYYFSIHRERPDGSWESIDSIGGNPYSFTVQDPSIFDIKYGVINSYTAEPLDLDGDGLINAIKVIINFTTYQDDSWGFDVTLATNTGGCQFGIWLGHRWYQSGTHVREGYVFTQTHLYQCQEFQTKNIEIWRIKIYDGSHDLNDILIHIEGFSQSLDEFDQPPSSYPYGTTVTEVDQNNNSLIDYLELSFMINISVAGTYDFQANVHIQETGQWRDHQSTGPEWFEPGTYQIKIPFMKQYNQGDVNVSYIFNGIWLYAIVNDDWSHVESFGSDRINIITPIYSYDMFEPPEAMFTGDLYFEPVSEGETYSGLNAILVVTITKAQTFHFDWTFCTKDTNNCFGGSLDVYLDIGTQDVLFFHQARDFKQYLTEDIFLREARVYQWIDRWDWSGWDQIHSLNEPGTILPANTYSSSQFSHPFGAILEVQADYGLDIDGNGKFEYIVVPILVKANYRLDYSIGMALKNDTWVDINYQLDGSTDAGTKVIELKYPTINLYDQQIALVDRMHRLYFHAYADGPGYWDSLEELYDLPLSQTWHLSQFDVGEVHPYDWQFYYEDLDHDGLLDNVVVEFQIITKTSGRWHLGLSPHDHYTGCGSWRWINIRTNAFEPRTVVLRMPFNVFNQEAMDCHQDIGEEVLIRIHELTVWRHDPKWERVYSYGLEHTMSPLNKSDINLNQLSYSFNSAWYEDATDDGYYDTLMLNLTLNAFFSGAYRISIQILDRDNNNWYGHQEWNLFLTSGITTLLIPFRTGRWDMPEGARYYKIGYFSIGKPVEKDSIDLVEYYVERGDLGWVIGEVNPSQWTDQGYGSSYMENSIDRLFINGTEYSWDDGAIVQQYSIYDVLNVTVVAAEFGPTNPNSPWLMQARVDTQGRSIYDFGTVLKPTSTALTFTGFVRLERVMDGDLYINYDNQLHDRHHEPIVRISVLGFPIPEIASLEMSPLESELWEQGKFQIDMILVHYNVTLDSVSLIFIKSASQEFTVLMPSISRNSTHQMFRVTETVALYPGILPVVLEIVVSGVTIQSPLSHILSVKDDSSPQVVVISYPKIIYVNQIIDILVQVTDDRGIDKVKAKHSGSGVYYDLTNINGTDTTRWFLLQYNFTKKGTTVLGFLVYDSIGQVGEKYESFSILVYDSQAPEILDYGYLTNPADIEEVRPNTQLNFFVVTATHDEMVTSVSMLVNDEESVAFEKNQTTENNDTWVGSFTPEKEGTYTFDIRVLNTANKDQTITITIEVKSGSSEPVQRFTTEQVPGFEIMVVLGFLSLASAIIRRKNRK